MECLNTYAKRRSLRALRWACGLLLVGSFQLALAGVEPAVSITSVDLTADEAGPDTATFTITRSVVAPQQLIVNLDITGSAARLTDYQIDRILSGAPLAVGIPANQASVTVTITPIADNQVEGTEDVVAALQPGTGYQVDSVDDEVTLTIADDVPEVNLTLIDAAMDEQGQVPGRFRVTRSPNGNTLASLTVDIDIAGTATRNVDYSITGVIGGNPLAVNIPSNQLEVIVVLTPRLDSMVEGTETIQVTLVPDPTSYTVGADTQAELTLADSVPEVNLSLVEGAMDEAGPVTGRFRVTRTNAGNPTAALTVNIDITGTAQRNVDYNLGSIFAGSPLAVQIPANVNEAEFVLTPRPDNIVEGVEDVQITLQPDPSLYTVGTQTQADLTLADSVTEVNLSVVDSSMDEAGLVAGTYRVTRTNAGNINQAITVNVDVTGTAAINTDYRPISLFAGAPFAVNLGIGETEAIFTFEPRADNVLEETETIVVTLQPNASTYTVGSQTQADFTLADDPVVVTLTQEDDTLAEQDLETGSFLVTRSNNGDLTRSLLVNLEVGGTATQNVDYRIEDVFGSSPATTTIPANELEARIVLTPIADQPDNEPDESIELRLLESTSYSVGTTAPLTFTLFDLIDFLFADGFELAPVPQSCSLSELSKLVPERFVDQGSSLLDLDTGLSWSRCGLTGRQDPLGSGCLPDNLAAWPALTDGFWLQRFNEGWVGDNEGFSDWRQASERELKSLPMACGNALVR